MKKEQIDRNSSLLSAVKIEAWATNGIDNQMVYLEEYIADQFLEQLQSRWGTDTFEDTQQFFSDIGVYSKDQFNSVIMNEAIVFLFMKYVNNETLLTALINAVDFDVLEGLLGALYEQYCLPDPVEEISDEENPGH